MRLKLAVLAGDGIGPEVTREATNILRNEEDGRDLSDVLQELLAEWITRHKNR